MKFLTRFIVPNVSAEKIGIDLTKSYVCEFASRKPPQNFIFIKPLESEKHFLMEVQEFDFFEDRIVFRGWLNYNLEYLCKAAVELRTAP